MVLFAHRLNSVDQAYIVFIGNGVNILLEEIRLDGNFVRLALCVLLPLFFAVSLVRIPFLPNDAVSNMLH